MKLTRVKICNFRSFGAIEQTIEINNITSFIGNNCSGKTAALAALNCMFSENASERILQRSDFHLPNSMEPENMQSQSLYIEAVFCFDELDGEELNAEDSVPQFFQHLVVDGPGGTPYLRVRLDATWEKGSSVEGIIESRIRYITCPESVAVTENDFITARRRDLDRIRVIYIPAMRDPSRQLRNTSGTMMYQIMSSINWSDATKNNVREKIEDLNAAFEQEAGVSMFGSSISKQWKTYDSDRRYSNATLRFNSTDIESSIKKAEVVFMPTETGKEYSIDQMSDGLRSLFYISLVDSILDVENQINEQIAEEPLSASFSCVPPLLTIVAIEEPENHIAPHLLGKLVINLKSIASKKNAQAILTSHSPAIVKRVDPETIRHFRLAPTDSATRVREITLPDKEKTENQFKFIKEAVQAYPELYFAKLVILGEGDSEELLLPKFWESINGNIDLSGVSIVPLGGRHVNYFWRLLHDLNIPFLTLLDLDRERYGGGWGRIKYVLDQLLQFGARREEILSLSDKTLSEEEFQAMSDWDDSQIEKMQAWIEKLEHYGVYFSAPLDIDYLMLENFGEEYKEIITDGEGPRIQVTTNEKVTFVPVRSVESKEPALTEYTSRVNKDVRNTLKECGGNGITYSDGQKRLMIWYNYFFMNRGKPSTHIVALSSIQREALKDKAPAVFYRLFTTAEQMMLGDTNENSNT